MRTTRLVPVAATLAAASMLALSAGPALAADVVAQAEATALEVTVAGSGTDSGTYTSTHDGTTETTTGTNQPAIGALGGQDLVTVGTLAQDATSSVVDTYGTSAACSGLAGDGATVVEVGDGSCLSGGDQVAIKAANLDLTSLTLTSGQVSDQLAAAGLDTTQLTTALAPVTSALSSGLQTAVTSLGDPHVVVDLGAVQAHCKAAGGTASGGANIADASIYVSGMDQKVVLAELPVDPAPNTHVVTDLDAVVTAITTALSTNFATALDGQLDPVTSALIDPIQAQLVEGVVAQIAPQLAPLQDNLLDITLNEQATAPGAIQVTALHLEVLPAARDFVGANLADLTIGRVKCGPNGRVIPRAAPVAHAPKPKKQAVVPTSIPAGAASADDLEQDHGLGAGALAGLVLVAAGAGVVGYRRFAAGQ